MAIYETVVILDSLLPTKDIDDIIERCSTVIKEHGGNVRLVDKWGKRRLAYEIQKKQYGFYFAIEFEGEGEIPTILQSEYNYNDSVLRYLTYKYDKHKIKAMEQAPVRPVVVEEPVVREKTSEKEPTVVEQVEVEKPSIKSKKVEEETTPVEEIVEEIAEEEVPLAESSEEAEDE